MYPPGCIGDMNTLHILEVIYMNVYETDKIRNVVLLGHGGAGKTTLTEALAFITGITKRMGKVTDGTLTKKKQNVSSPSVPPLFPSSGKAIK